MAAAAEPQRQEEQQTSWGRTILNIVTIYFAVNAVTSFIGSRLGGQKEVVSTGGTKAPAAAGVKGVEQFPALWPLGTQMDLSIYLGEDVFPTFEEDKLVFKETGIELGDWSVNRKASVDVPISKAVQNNGSLFAHIFVSQSGAPSNPSDPSFDPERSFHAIKLLSRYMPKRKEVHLKKLIKSTEETEKEPEVETPKVQPTVSYWHPNLTIGIISDNKPLQLQGLPEPLAKHVRLFMKDGQRSYYPIVYPNDFWLLKDHMQEINSTVKTLPLHIEVYPTSFWKVQIFSTMDDSFKKQQENPGPLGQTSSGAEIDEFKKMLIDTNPILLVTTFLVSILHSLFEFLAFKNDISHWRSKKDNTGVSFRTIISNVVMQAIIFLYLLDQSENTSWLIMAGQGFGILLEMWKVTKTVNIRVQPTNGLIPYRIIFEDKHVLSETEAKTKEYDQVAFTYMYWGGIPLLLAYAVYSLLYEEHKSWYSYTVTTLVGFVYAWGFLMMVPALYINYRLHSVAHMPRRTMVYKFLNTIVDDLFSFCISMPTLHRLACFRDDVIFVIYLYQMYAYKVDKTRVNEYGQGGDDDDDVNDAAQGTGPTVKPLPVEEKKESKKVK